jgi:hypothetical protein
MTLKRYYSLFFLSLLTPCAAVAADLSYPALTNAAHFVSIDNVCAWPMLTQLPDGSILAAAHNDPSHALHECDVDCWASDNGEFWHRLGTATAHEPNTARMNHAFGLARNGDVLMLVSGWSNEQQPGKPKAKPFRDAILRCQVARSRDGGKTWTTRREFPAPDPGLGEYVPFGNILAADDGSLRTSCYTTATVDDAGKKVPGHQSFMFRSDDDGNTWKKISVIGPRHDETALFRLDGKRWLAAARFKEVDIFRSDDDGTTWQGPFPATAPDELNGHLLKLRDGRLVLAFGDRVKGQCGVCAKISSDDGRTWGSPFRLADSLVADCGYPSSVQRADGKIVTVFYTRSSREHDRYHMGTIIWDAPASHD